MGWEVKAKISVRQNEVARIERTARTTHKTWEGIQMGGNQKTKNPHEKRG